MEIKINNLSYKYDQKEVLKDINLTFQQGKIYTILGPNGTGKSTFVKAVLGNEDSICQGEIKLGSNVSIGYIPQEIRFEDENWKKVNKGRCNLSEKSHYLKVQYKSNYTYAYVLKYKTI